MLSPIRHRFVAIDEGLGTLLHIDESDPSRDWIVPIGQPQARDLQLVGGNRILVGHHHGYTEYDLCTGTPVSTFAELEGVTSVRRQEDGSTLIAGVNLAGNPGVSVLTIDVGYHIRHRAAFPGDYVRLVRQTTSGTFLMCCNDRIREGSPEGGYLREFSVDGFYHAWKAVGLANGHLLVSAGYGAFLVELDKTGKVVRRWGGKDAVPDRVNPLFYAMLQLLYNGHVVVANWQGHGPGHGGSGIQLLEFDTSGAIVWQWSDPERISSLQGLVVLDGLDTSLLHDERNGSMQPLASSSSAR
jgi:hypothetical protein